jgi:leucyl-tRNA synthetase
MEVIMTTAILALTDPHSPTVSLRCREYAAFTSRIRKMEGETTVVHTGYDPAAALVALARTAVVTTASGPAGDEESGRVLYVPSRAARERVGTGRDGEWPQALTTRQRRALRRTVGAIFQLPVEGAGSDGGDTDILEVFITEWSASPAACAVAVHPAHPLSAGLTPGSSAAFTGRYCRHPLTGDLLPVWVAAWVKPEFGSGAVLVNPAHDEVDLAFAREVGLPVRFALAPPGSDGSPETWPVPPLIRTGTAIRTGSTDGLTYGEARAEYFRILSGRGLAAEYADFGMGSFPVGDLSEEGSAKVGWETERRTVAGAGGGTAVRFSAYPVLAGADPQVRSSELLVVAPSAGVEAELLAFRLLLAEPGLTPPVVQAPEVLLVGSVSGATDGVDEPALRLTMTAVAGWHESASVKTQQVEASQRFLDTHATIAEKAPSEDDTTTADVAKAASQVKGLLRRKDTKQAFTQLYRLQKSLAKAASVSRGDVLAYEAVAFVLAGAEGGHDRQQFVAAWRAL